MSVEGVVYGLQVEGDILTCHHWGGPDLVQNTVTYDRPKGALTESEGAKLRLFDP